MNEPTEAVVVSSQSQAITRIADNAMSVDDILAQVTLIQKVMSKVMTEGEHYGTIPGCGNKQTLLQPGAQKLTMTFRLAPEYQIQETNFDKGHKEYRVICTLKSIATGNFVGQGVGCCSTLESKYRWKGGARKCPECHKETIIKGKAEYGGGWLCFAKKGGCGAKWEDGAAEIESQNVDKVEHDSPADFYNTVLKMAKKRAFVDATITATAASDIFTQDIGDDEGGEPSKSPQDAPASRPPQRPAQASKPAASPKSGASAPTVDKNRETAWDPKKFLENCKARLLELIPAEEEWVWWRYATDQDWILPTETLADARAQEMFQLDTTNGTTAKESIAKLVEKHMTTVKAMAANCPPEMKEEIMRGFQPMKRATAPKPAKEPKTKGSCPSCNSTAVKKHDDLLGVTWCQQCGTQWQDSDPNKDYEEHDWMFAELPFAPKDPDKKGYKGMTLGQLSRIDSKYWFGIVMNFKAEPFRGRPPSEASVKFAEACEKARQHLKPESEPSTKARPEPSASDAQSGDDDDIPF